MFNNEEKLKFIDKMKYNNRLAYLIISFNQGIGSISELAIQYYFKDELHIEPARLSQIFSLILIPWTIKPFFGIITDLFPICGYRRKIYMIICGIITILSWISMSFFVNSLFQSILCLLLINISVSFSTVLGEAVVVELSQLEKLNTSSTAKDYVSMFFFCKYTGALVSAYLKGLFVEIMAIRSVFLISSALSWLLVSAGCILIEVRVREEEEKFINNDEPCNDLGQNKKNLEMINKIKEMEKLNQKENYNNEAEYFTLVNNDKINELDNQIGIEKNNNLKYSAKTAVLSNLEEQEINEEQNNLMSEKKIKDNNNLNDSFNSIFHPKEKLSPRELLKEFANFISQKYVLVPTLYLILLMATPSYGDPFFYFLTNELKFSASSLGKISFCSTAGTLIAIWVYKNYFKDCKFKLMITVGTIVSFFFSFMAYLLVLRINISFGIPDFYFVLFSSSFLSIIGELVMMPMLALACLLCPKNLEGTVYALFMSALNFGGILSGLFGSLLTSYLRITSKDYHNLHILISISNVLTLVPLPFLFLISDSFFEPNPIEHNIEIEKRNK